MPRPRPESSFRLPASSFVLVQLPAFCQRLFAKLIPKKVSQTCDLKQSVPARLEQPTNHPPPFLLIYPSAKSYIQKDSPFALFLFYSFCCCSCCLPSGQWPPPQLCSAQLGQHTICDNSFLRINICSACVPVLLGPPLHLPFLPLSFSLNQSLTGCAFICLVAPPDLACLLFVLFVSALYLN